MARTLGNHGPVPARLLRILRLELARQRIDYRRVAEAAGVSWSMVYKVIKGQRQSYRVIRTMSRLTGVDLPEGW